MSVATMVAATLFFIAELRRPEAEPHKHMGKTETCSLGLLCTSLILDIHVMIN